MLEQATSIINTPIVSDGFDVFWQMPESTSGWESRPVLVISSYFENGAPEENQLFSLLASGCKLSPTQYHLLKMRDNEAVGWMQLKNKLQPNIVLLFNIHQSDLGISVLFKLNEVNNYDGKLWIPTVSLNHLQQDKNMKIQLWNNALKPVFELKKFGSQL